MKRKMFILIGDLYKKVEKILKKPAKTPFKDKIEERKKRKIN